jgi:hypothetical protein
MRKSVLFLMKTVLVLGLVFATGCGKDDDEGKDDGGSSGNNTEKTIPDPAGTITRNLSNSGIRLNSYNSEERGTAIEFSDDVTWVAMTTSNEFRCQYCSIASVGKVAGLGNITRIPTSGFVGRNSVELGYGYVVACEDGTYARLYVVEWTKSTSGGIIGAKVKYQYPFVP